MYYVCRHYNTAGLRRPSSRLVRGAPNAFRDASSRRRQPAVGRHGGTVDSLPVSPPAYAGGSKAAAARPFDPDTGLQNNLNRWYDASVGRWLSEAPIGFAAGDENLYRDLLHFY